MGIYDREYIRRDGHRFFGSLGDRGQVCKWLIIINVVVFVLQIITLDHEDGGPFGGGLVQSPLTRALILNVEKVQHGQVCAY